MTRGITRAADRVAIWHVAADKPEKVDIEGFEQPSTSAPPPGVSPPEPTEMAPVVVPNSNKFKYPANKLKNLTLTLGHGNDVGKDFGEAGHPAVKEYLDTPAGQGFVKTYFK